MCGRLTERRCRSGVHSVIIGVLVVITSAAGCSFRLTRVVVIISVIPIIIDYLIEIVRHLVVIIRVLITGDHSHIHA